MFDRLFAFVIFLLVIVTFSMVTFDVVINSKKATTNMAKMILGKE